MIILVFFVVHWQLSVFFQSFFLHRYGAHQQVTMSRGWERCFYLCTWFFQGASFLVPRAYAVLHRMHHAYSDTPRDPHSPNHHRNVFTMMWATKKRYEALVSGREIPEERFAADAPRWETLDRIGGSWPVRVTFLALYVLVYALFASAWWMWLLLPFHFVMGPMHGAIVNWCGHRYGYRNFESDDDSRNTLPFDFVTCGELFQNNHHRFAMSPNFGARRFEVDPGWLVIRAFAALRIVRIHTAQRARWPATSLDTDEGLADSPRP
jgi:stearoyl-CoA desaturase (delta-9 desaturase)